MNDDAYLEAGAATFRRASESFMRRRFRARRRRRVLGTLLALAMVPAGTALAAQERKSSTVTVSSTQTESGEAALLVEVDEGADGGQVLLDLHQALRDSGWNLPVRAANGPLELRGLIASDGGEGGADVGVGPYRRQLEVTRDVQGIAVVVDGGTDSYDVIGDRDAVACGLVGSSVADVESELAARGYSVLLHGRDGAPIAPGETVVLLTAVAPDHFVGLVSDELDVVGCS